MHRSAETCVDACVHKCRHTHFFRKRSHFLAKGIFCERVGGWPGLTCQAILAPHFDLYVFFTQAILSVVFVLFIFPKIFFYPVHFFCCCPTFSFSSCKHQDTKLVTPWPLCQEPNILLMLFYIIWQHKPYHTFRVSQTGLILCLSHYKQDHMSLGRIMIYSTWRLIIICVVLNFTRLWIVLAS